VRFGFGQLLAGIGSRAGARRSVLGVEGGGEGCFAIVFPFVPAFGQDLGTHLRVQPHDGGVGAPGSAEIDARSALLGGEAAVVEVGDGVAEDEIDVAFDIALGEILARGDAGAFIGFAAFAVGVERILVAEEADAAEDGAIAHEFEGEGLGAFLRERTIAAEAVFDSQVFGVEIIAGDGDAGGFSGASRSAGAVIEAEDDCPAGGCRVLEVESSASR